MANDNTKTSKMNTEIIEGGKLICEFMGGKKLDSGGNVWYYEGPDGFQHESGQFLKYHTDWNWLMEVVVKIESLESKRFGFHIDPHDVSIVDYKTESENAIVYSTRQEYSLKEAVYEAVIQFITWYNQISTNK